MNRRDALCVAATVAVGSMAGRSATAAIWGGEDAVVIADRLLRAYPSGDSLAVIGDAYWQERATTENEVCRPCRAEAIHGLLDHVSLSSADLGRMSPGDLQQRLKSETTRDFVEGRTVRVKGWLLGETEARLCAIAALPAA